ncbi:hypothetical protein [Bernardetia sp. MNP-M8]|uniref:hypothetical protein n=1 Tax=Bernardetia sp. MNP-M8 TaxID=3127470 RepID=UPI0030CA7D26
MALKSEGVCFYCNEIVSKQGITKHISSHLKKMEKEINYDTKSTDTYYQISITADEMFLVIIIESKVSFTTLDVFLRDIWVECCGHMSSFRTKSGISIMDADYDSQSMKTPLSDIYEKGLIMDYEYDFGSTTYLKVKFVNEYILPKQKKKIKLISRNEPLPIVCTMCKKEYAREICLVDIDYDYKDGYFCKKCSKEHAKECEDFDDYAKTKIVNSPRAGICGYDGGSIDKKRDGYYKPKTIS